MTWYDYHPDYSKHVKHSSELKGLTGDNGEEWVTFFSNKKNPLASAWKWFRTKEEAMAFDPIAEKGETK